MESKQDVFDEVLDELAYAIGDNDRLTEDQIDAELADFRARYAAADKVAVPREVGEWIDCAKSNNFSLYEAMFAAQSAFSGIFSWVASH